MINQPPKILSMDDKGRIVLPKSARSASFYAYDVSAAGVVTLRPQVIVDPSEVISKKTLQVLDESLAHLQEGRAGKPVDLSAFDTVESSSNEKERRKIQKTRSKK